MDTTTGHTEMFTRLPMGIVLVDTLTSLVSKDTGWRLGRFSLGDIQLHIKGVKGKGGGTQNTYDSKLSVTSRIEILGSNVYFCNPLYTL